MDNKKIYNEFLIESNDALSSIGGEITQLEKGPEDKEILNDIYRKVHTLKGSSSFLGFSNLQEITHSAENLLDLLREGNIRFNSEIADVLLKCFDLCSSIIKEIERNGTEGDVDIKPLKILLLSFIEKLNDPNHQNLISSNESDKVQLANNQDEGTDLDELIQHHSQYSTDDSSSLNLEAKETITKDVVQEDAAKITKENAAKEITENKTIEEAKEKDLDNNFKSNVSDSIIRVSVELLDKILNVVGELVLNRNQILQYTNTINDPQFLKLSQQLNSITTELQNDIMMTRMQPIGNILGKYERLVRDFSRANQKKIRLKITGQETELDKTLIEAIKDPLTHIIRNAIDHGIENSDERKKTTKPEEATIAIRAYHESGQVAIEISDDGKGINKQRVKEKAIEKGIITQEGAKDLSDNEIINLIFLPGFSTAEKITNISGRGVGMDVVKTNIEKIGGSINIETHEGTGSSFKLKIPLTLAIIPSLIVESSGQKFSIPQINLMELVRIENNKNNNSIEKINDAEFYRLRGKIIPIIRLDNVFKLKEKSNDENLNIVIVNAEGIIYGIVVDQIQDTEEIVVKPLGKNLKNCNMFAGATIMGDGNVSLIIDVFGLLGLAQKNEFNNKQGASVTSENKSDEAKTFSDVQENILVRLSDKRIYGIPLCLVARLEEFEKKQIEYSGDIPIVRYMDKPVQLIDVEKSLNLNTHSKLNRNDEESSSIQCVMVKMQEKYHGIAVEEILDIDVSKEEIDFNNSDRKGISGTIFNNKKIVSIIDVFKIIDEKKVKYPTDNPEKIKDNNQFRILVVDDSLFYRSTIQKCLIQSGYKVQTAIDGEEAFNILKKDNQFNAVLTDIEMPKMNGYELSQKINSDANLKIIPVVAISTRFSDNDKIKGKNAGFRFHLEKLKEDEILSTVSNLLKTGS